MKDDNADLSKVRSRMRNAIGQIMKLIDSPPEGDDSTLASTTEWSGSIQSHLRVFEREAKFFRETIRARVAARSTLLLEAAEK